MSARYKASYTKRSNVVVVMQTVYYKRYILYTHSARKQKDHVPMVYFDPNLTICLNHTTCIEVYTLFK